jgi:hypothetical protein
VWDVNDRSGAGWRKEKALTLPKVESARRRIDFIAIFDGFLASLWMALESIRTISDNTLPIWRYMGWYQASLGCFEWVFF